MDDDTERLLNKPESLQREYVLPNRLSTHKRRILSLVVVSICCTIASGPLTGFPTLQPMLEKAQVFQGPQQGSLMALVSFHLH